MVNKGMIFGMMIWIAAFLLLAIGKVWFSHKNNEISHKYAKALQDQTALKQDIQQLDIELSSQVQPEQLRKVAKQLGMTAPRADQVLSAYE